MLNISSRELAKCIRKHALRMVHLSDASHIGSCLSVADILAVSYNEWLHLDPKNPEWEERDYFILSKGHSAAALYATLAEIGFFSTNLLETYSQDGSSLGGHVTHEKIPGVEISTGSLGHGLSIGIGLALGLKRDQKTNRVAVVLSDGELNEGSNWEAFLSAPHLHLDNLIVIIDYNKIQSLGRVEDVLPLEPLKEKLEAFHWAVKMVDGHNHEALSYLLREVPFKQNSPSVIIAHTIKGKGVSFMEDKVEWHYHSPDKEMLKIALEEIEKNG